MLLKKRQLNAHFSSIIKPVIKYIHKHSTPKILAENYFYFKEHISVIIPVIFNVCNKCKV